MDSEPTAADPTRIIVGLDFGTTHTGTLSLLVDVMGNITDVLKGSPTLTPTLFQIQTAKLELMTYM
jgi:hypothetical protein